MYKVEKVIITNTKDELGNVLSNTSFEMLSKQFHSYENACAYAKKNAEEDAAAHGVTVEMHDDGDYRSAVLDGFLVTRMTIFKVL